MTNLLLRVVSTLIAIESGGDPTSYNPSEDAAGILQMRPVAVREANRITGRHLWAEDDRWNPQLARAMCFETLRFHYLRGCTNPVELGAKWHRPYAQASPRYLRLVAENYQTTLQKE